MRILALESVRAENTSLEKISVLFTDEIREMLSRFRI